MRTERRDNFFLVRPTKVYTKNVRHGRDSEVTMQPCNTRSATKRVTLMRPTVPLFCARYLEVKAMLQAEALRLILFKQDGCLKKQ